MSTETCKRCGSEYEISEQKMTVRDKDSIECEVCGDTFMRWNGAVSYSAKLSQRGSLGRLFGVLEANVNQAILPTKFRVSFDEAAFTAWAQHQQPTRHQIALLSADAGHLSLDWKCTLSVRSQVRLIRVRVQPFDFLGAATESVAVDDKIDVFLEAVIP